jgi:hypothetical protein
MERRPLAGIMDRGRPCAKKSLASLMVKVHIEKGNNQPTLTECCN